MRVDRYKKIIINQYDTGEIPSSLWKKEWADDDRLFFGVYTFDEEFKDAFIVKTLDADGVIKLDSTDTKKTGKYRYSVKVQNGESITTIQPETYFIVER